MKNGMESLFQITLSTPFPVGDVHAYLLKGDTLSLIDAGPKTKLAAEQLNQQLKELGYRLDDIEQIILTHHHPDHCGQADLFRLNVPVLAHRNNARWLYREESFLEEHDRFYEKLAVEFNVPIELRKFAQQLRRMLDFSCQRPLDVTLSEGQELPGHPGWVTKETFGHAQGHLSFFHQREGLLIGGDFLLQTISPNPLLEPPNSVQLARPKPQLQYNASLHKLLQEDITLVYPGHGPVINKAHSLMEKRLNSQHDRAMYVKTIIADGPFSVFEICQRLFPKVYQKEVALTLSETVAQLDYLLELGQIEESLKAGVLQYSLSLRKEVN